MGDSSEKMKITDLNIDCLENVLKYLKFDDLLSAASSNKWLNKAANFVIIRKPWHKNVYFENMKLSRDRSFEIQNFLINICDIKTGLQFIRCFGHLIFNIELKYTKNRCELDQFIINHINEYCSVSLTSIKIDNFTFTPIEWEHLRKPFSKVEQVTSNGYNIDDKGCFNRLFPKMRELKVYFFGSEKSFFVKANHFPNLEQLHISDYASVLRDEIMAPILHLNPQLVDLMIYTNQPLFDSNDFQNAIKALQKLKTLSLNGNILFVKPFDSVICLNSVQTFKIHILSESLIKIPFLFGQLHKFILVFDGQLNAEFFSFIDKHPTIKELSLLADSLSDLSLSQIAKSLPLLVSIIFHKCGISANAAIDFMSKLENLNRFSFNINDSTAYDDFQATFGNEWECTLDTFNNMITLNQIGHKGKKRKVD